MRLYSNSEITFLEVLYCDLAEAFHLLVVPRDRLEYVDYGDHEETEYPDDGDDFEG